MVQLSSKIILNKVTIYNSCSLKNIKLINSFFKHRYINLLNYKLKKNYKKLVFLRSPKHFNAGKHQVFYINTTVFYTINLQYTTVNFLDLRKDTLVRNFKSLVLIPHLTPYHYKLNLRAKLCFKI